MMVPLSFALLLVKLLSLTPLDFGENKLELIDLSLLFVALVLLSVVP